MTLSPADASGVPFGPYTVLRALAEGGTGEVYLARKTGSSEVVILKKLRGALEANSTAGKRLYREAHLATLLDHEHIARVIDAGFVDETFYLTMEFVSGQTIEAILERRPARLPPPMSISIAISLLDALAYAHTVRSSDGRQLGLVHRDISPRNVLVRDDGVVKVIDFGSAHARLDDFKTATGYMVGTLVYMSPEQIRGKTVDRRSDLYSAGALLYEMLAGQPPVAHGAVVEIAHAVVHADPTPLRSINPEVSIELEKVVNRALRKDRDDRWANAADMKAALLATPEGKTRASTSDLQAFLHEHFDQPELGTVIVGEHAELHLATRVDLASFSGERSPPRRSLLPIIAVAAFVLGAAIVAGAIPEREIELRAETVPSASPQREPWIATPRADPTVAPQTPPIPQPPPQSVVDEPRQVARPAPAKPAPIPEMNKRRAKPPSDLMAMLERVEQAPEDQQLFFELRRRIAAAARALPKEEERRVLDHLDSADMMFDPAALRSAIEALNRRRR